MMIHNVNPELELNKIYFCGIICQRVYDWNSKDSHTGTITSVEEATQPIIQNTSNHVQCL